MIMHSKRMNKQWKGASRLKYSKTLRTPDNDHHRAVTHLQGDRIMLGSSPSTLGTVALSNMTKFETELTCGQMTMESHIWA